MSASNHDQHRTAQRRGWGSPGAGYSAAHSSAAHDKAQSGASVRPVGIHRRFVLSSGLMQFLPVRTGRGLNRSGLFSHSIARWPGTSLSDRRLVLPLLPERGATYFHAAHEVLRRGRVHHAARVSVQFSLRFNGRSSHLCVPHNLARQSSYVPERHSSVPFVVRRLDDDEHSERNLSRAQNPFVQGARSV
jgi:hypothetical protein